MCFGCSTHNAASLGLRFYYDPEHDEAVSFFSASSAHSSFPGVVHGGIISVLADEVAYWALQLQAKRPALTTRLDVRYLRPARVGSTLEVRAKAKPAEAKQATVEVRVLDEKQQVCAQATVTYALVAQAAMKAVLGPVVETYSRWAQETTPQ